MTKSVTVTTGARLHFGPLSYGAPTGRSFGGIGAMIDSPRFRLTVSRADQEAIDAPDEIAGRIAQCLNRLRGQCVGLLPAVKVEVEDAIPAHRGLGSGTQLALAVGQAMHLLAFGRPADVLELARLTLRGRRSAIGIHGFQHGGFLVDAGKSAPSEIGELSVRFDFPDEWRFVLVVPKEVRGLSGETELAAFEQLPPMPAETTNRLCRLVLTELLPAVRGEDFDAFSMALFEYGCLVGDYFAPVQGSRFTHPQAKTLIEQLRAAGCPGVAQTSWGPTLAVVVPSESQARQLVDQYKQRNVVRTSDYRIARPLNIGATCSLTEHPTGTGM